MNLVNTSEAASAAMKTRDLMISERMNGWDPYDALTSPIFKLPLLKSNWLIRFGLQQLILRSPVNPRPLLRTPKRRNPVTVGLYVQGLADLADAGLLDRVNASTEAAAWITDLERSRTPGWHGSCWGYPFPWEGRRGAHRTPEGFPTVVATSMILNGVHRAWKAFGLDSAKALVADGAGFVLEDLNRVAGDERAFCWTYSPADGQAVLNATMKGTRLLAQAEDAGAGIGSAGIELAQASARFVAEHQQEDGGWPYAVDGDPRTWRDHFHTGYILECYDTFRAITGEHAFDATVSRGYDHYRTTFFNGATPRYWDNNDEPLDPTAAAQALLTLPAFGDAEFANKVVEAVMPLLGNADGSFRYRGRGGRGRAGGVHYLRWSTAWMFAGLAHVARANTQASSETEFAD